LFYKILEKTNSPINGEITIYSIFGSPRMSIGGLLQSGGVVADIWKKAIKRISSIQCQVSSVLILGLGCGTAAKLFSEKWPQAKIVGVEIDPTVIRLGKKYFGLDKIPNLEIVRRDAINYVSKCQVSGIKEKFNLILVDLYLGEKVPQKAESLTFLRNLLSSKSFVVFNRLFWDEHKKRAELFVKKIEKIFSRVELVRTVANLLVFCFQTD
jgi:spermidine synthase